MNVGTEWLVEAEECAAESLSDLEAVRRVCHQIIGDLGLTVVGDPAWHKFSGPGGVTGLFLLTESHLACHTYPESGIATFNLYCCRSRPAWPWAERLRDLLGARRVVVRQLGRGSGVESAEPDDSIRKAASGREGAKR
jgi:S-adenosylmethionine decarboxylase